MRGQSGALVAALLIAFVALNTSVVARAAAPVAPAAPTGLTMTRFDGQPIVEGGWINRAGLKTHFQIVVGSVPLTPQVEFQPVSVPFTGTPNFSGSPIAVSGPAVVSINGLKNGFRYHWAARVTDGHGGVSNWVDMGVLGSTGSDVGIDRNPPARPVIYSSTNPNSNDWYHTSVEKLHWSAQDPLSGVAGYTYALERDPHVIAPGSITTQHTAKITNLGNGDWFMAIRAVDRAGNWSPTATFRIQIDRQLPQITWLSPSRFVYNPYHGPVTVRFRVDKQTSTYVNLYRVGSKQPVAGYAFRHLPAGRAATITWYGKKDGKVVRAGYYFFSAVSIDHANNVLHQNVGGFIVHPAAPLTTPSGQQVYADGGKRIIVSLSKEALYAYNGNHLDLETLVTTGNPSLPTPEGHYTVMEKIHPFEFVSPWPVGSPFYYAPSWVQYAMLFRQGGYFLHDAPWRSAYGPGTDGPGQPGTNYGGSHGCVNIPPVPMTFLWNWTPIGTPVDVVP